MIEDLLRRYDIRLDTDQGQHFLDDEALLRREVDEADLDGDETVLEIGAGLGTLTKEIARQADLVHAVERDTRLIDALEQETGGFENIEIIEGDILEIDWPDFDICISNPPYEISAELIERLGRAGKLSVLTLQKAFAQKLVAEPGSGEYSRMTVMANYYFIPVYLQDIPAASFSPEPEVESALVKLFPREKKPETGDEEAFFTLVRALFTHKRKKVRNAFVDARHILDITKDRGKELQDELPYSEERVINLDLQQLAEISSWLEGRL